MSERVICWNCRSEQKLEIPIKYLYSYKSLGGELLRLYKFEGWKKLATFFADELIKLKLQPWPIITVPPGKRNQRYWEPVYTIAKEIKKITGSKIIMQLSQKQGRNQKKLGRFDRIHKNSSLNLTIKNIPEKAILLDDVVTTGTTMNNCARYLKSLGVKEIHGLCVCLR